MLGLFVDDMFVIGKVMELIEGVKGFLHIRFKMKGLGLPSGYGNEALTRGGCVATVKYSAK